MSEAAPEDLRVPEVLAVVGYGLLGRAFAHRLDGAGRSVMVSDTAGDLSDRVVGTTHHPATLTQAAERAECIFVTVYTAAQVGSVIDQLARTRPNRRPAATIVVSTTLTPAEARSLAAKASAAGLEFVEFPVSGTSAQIVDGDGFGIVGLRNHGHGLDADLRSLLEALTPTLELVGPIGAASAMKLAINLVLEVNRSALAEGIIFAESLGIEPSTFARMAQLSAAESKVMFAKLPKMVAGDFSPEGRSEQSLKDVSIMLALADTAALELPLLRAQRDLLTSVVANGDGALDAAVVISELRRRRGSER